jgi:hypothetical protein
MPGYDATPPGHTWHSRGRGFDPLRLRSLSFTRPDGDHTRPGAGPEVSFLRHKAVVVIARACRPEIDGLPEEVRADLADALARLDGGLMLSMPLSRPMAGIAHGVHELRLKARSGQYRISMRSYAEGACMYCTPSRKRLRRRRRGTWPSRAHA